MIRLIRKIFGYETEVPESPSVQEDFWSSQNIPEEHKIEIDDKWARLEAGKGYSALPDEEQKELISKIVSSVLAEKEKSFVSYTEEAMDFVTDNQYRYIKYRNVK